MEFFFHIVRIQRVAYKFPLSILWVAKHEKNQSRAQGFPKPSLYFSTCLQEGQKSWVQEDMLIDPLQTEYYTWSTCKWPATTSTGKGEVHEPTCYRIYWRHMRPWTFFLNCYESWNFIGNIDRRFMSYQIQKKHHGWHWHGDDGYIILHNFCCWTLMCSMVEISCD